MFSLLNSSPLMFLELGLEVAAPHFEAELRPGPDVSDGSPDLLLLYLWLVELDRPGFFDISITHLKFFLVGSFLGKCSTPLSFV